MPTWKDCTSWSQGHTKEQRKTPRTWELKVGSFRLVITRHRDYDADQWVLLASGLIISDLLLKARDVDDAKREVAAIIGARMREIGALADVIDPRP
jgi:hypothetical protein